MLTLYIMMHGPTSVKVDLVWTTYTASDILINTAEQISTYGEEHSLKVFRKIFGSKREKVTWAGRGLYGDWFIICTSHQILLG
jgi:hypothetical protein